MKALLQVVSDSNVKVDNTVIGQIDKGLLVLLGVAKSDSQQDVDYLSNKIINLRCFVDDSGKFQKDIRQVEGSILVISQFTLLAKTQKGRRPDFMEAADPGTAQALYLSFIQQLRNSGIPVQTGEFGAKMEVSLTNQGPVTLWLDSKV